MKTRFKINKRRALTWENHLSYYKHLGTSNSVIEAIKKAEAENAKL